MHAFEPEEQKLAGWLQPLADDTAPCGPDLESDGDFIALNAAAAGNPNPSFGDPVPPDWREVVSLADGLLDRSRDLRIAVLWLRGLVHQRGYGALVPGLRLVVGLIDGHWDHVHPLPDPDDGDPYARVNALSVLVDNAGLMADLRAARLVQDRATATVGVRQALVALGQLPANADEAGTSRAQLTSMLADVATRQPGLRSQFTDAVALSRQLARLASDKLGDAAPDLRPLCNLAQQLASLLPPEDAADVTSDESAAPPPDSGAQPAAAGGVGGRSLSGMVRTREDAIRAIDMVCDYLDQAEPTNPAQLFLRRGQQLIGQNFLQLIKALAPDALGGVAAMVGVDPSSLDASSNQSSDDSDNY
jgi:type VI secretion system protein ImpA